MNYMQPPPEYPPPGWYRPGMFSGLLAAVLALVLLGVALLEVALAGDYSGSTDGYPTSLGAPFYLALGAAAACLVSSAVSFVYAFTGKWGVWVWLTLMLAVAATIGWRVVLAHGCAGCQ